MAAVRGGRPLQPSVVDQKQYGRTWFAQAFEANEEVARLRLNVDVDVIGFVGVPTARVPDLEIVYLQVAAARRGQGIGTSVISALTHRYSLYRLVAASKGADGFWAGLGGPRCVHGADPRFRPPMFFI